MSITYYALIAALPIYLSVTLHAGKNVVGVVLASYTIASVIIRPFSGFGLDRYGRKTVFLIALLIYTFITCGYIVTNTIAWIIVLRLIHGLSWGVSTISSSTVAVDNIPSETRGEGIGYYSLSTTIGMAVGPMAGLFFWQHWGYGALFISAFLISLAALLCASMIHFEPLPFPRERIHFSWRNLLDKPSILPSLSLLIIMSTYGGLLSFIALYGKELGIKNSSGFFLLFAIGIGLSRFFSGKLIDRKGPQGILSFCIVLLMIGYPFLALVQNEVGFYTSALILGIGIGVVFPVFQTMVNNQAPSERRGAANSTLYTFLDIGMGLGMLLMGSISHHSSIQTALLIWSAICFIGLIHFNLQTMPHYKKNTL